MLAQLFASAPLSGAGFLAFTALWLAATVFWLWMLWDCLAAGRVSRREKIVWVVVLLGTYVVGAMFYFVVVRIRRIGGTGR